MPMETTRASYFSHHTLVMSRVENNMVKQEEKTFNSKHEMIKWMHDHVDDGYDGFWSQSVEVNDVEWVSIDRFRKTGEGILDLCRRRGYY